MNRSISFLASVVMYLTLSVSVLAAENIVESVAKGCEKELSSYCKNVTVGEGRVLACLYAYGDKLSGQCEYALYDAAVQLQRFIAALSYVANECSEDLEQHCSAVAAGEGRLLACLKSNENKIKPRCSQALQDVGMK
ncbi:MAG: cysteine rich repeat-containing protein [Gammaproteobacteria bacterium]|nr:cysteine rich repeat-containing protein [Gammaproteobacteria bacterium]